MTRTHLHALQADAAAEAKRLEEERWERGSGGVTAQDVLAALRAKKHEGMREFEAAGGNFRWTSAIFRGDRYWKKGGTVMSGDRSRNTGLAPRQIWYRHDRDLAEAARRRGTPPPAPSIVKQPTPRMLRKALHSIRSTISWAQSQKWMVDDEEMVNKTLDWIRGMCGGDQ